MHLACLYMYVCMYVWNPCGKYWPTGITSICPHSEVDSIAWSHTVKVDGWIEELSILRLSRMVRQKITYHRCGSDHPLAQPCCYFPGSNPHIGMIYMPCMYVCICMLDLEHVSVYKHAYIHAWIQVVYDAYRAGWHGNIWCITCCIGTFRYLRGWIGSIGATHRTWMILQNKLMFKTTYIHIHTYIHTYRRIYLVSKSINKSLRTYNLDTFEKSIYEWENEYTNIHTYTHTYINRYHVSEYSSSALQRRQVPYQRRYSMRRRCCARLILHWVPARLWPQGLPRLI